MSQLDDTKVPRSSAWKLTLCIHSDLAHELLEVDSIWPLRADEVWVHVSLHNVLASYRLRFESPEGVHTIVPFSSVEGFTSFLKGAMAPGNRTGLLNTGSDAWLLELGTEHFSFSRCNLRFYDRHVELAEHFEWVESGLDELKEADLELVMRAPRLMLSDKSRDMARSTLGLLEASLQKGCFEPMTARESKVMQEQHRQHARSAVKQLFELVGVEDG